MYTVFCLIMHVTTRSMHPLNSGQCSIQWIQSILRIQYWILTDPSPLWIHSRIIVSHRFIGFLRIHGIHWILKNTLVIPSIVWSIEYYKMDINPTDTNDQRRHRCDSKVKSCIVEGKLRTQAFQQWFRIENNRVSIFSNRPTHLLQKSAQTKQTRIQIIHQSNPV